MNAPPAQTQLLDPFDLVLGRHLNHLRETHNRTLDTVSSALTGHWTATPHDLARLEAGQGAGLRDVLDAGHGPVLARACGIGRAAADWSTCLDEHRRDCASGTATPGISFTDTAPGWAHRYQLLEQQAHEIVYAINGDRLPAPLLDDSLRQRLWASTAPTALRQQHPGPRTGRLRAVSGIRCGLCQLYREGLTDTRLGAAQWERHVDQARAAVLADRIRRPGHPTVLFINEMMLLTWTRGTEIHTQQLRHLAELATSPSLRVRVLPNDLGKPIIVDRTELRIDTTVLTVTPAPRAVTYEALTDRRMSALRKLALPVAESMGMLQEAAAGTLERSW
ncbi:Scr1 family TA system antitoxin-like transcriptional regulator [Streptacidiphilus jiangxiensis]|uniref:DUF5753 domain-containing protein n=1 Tax=Streptacidiphilus jiangxiensis TaxID=235985 RepID=A0A1H8BXR6_STRJI|nr:Scr1 family TA system antitoxin-like transcriptional regulator [Streptacidiphilus jiangxiensis]SEM86798.1 hypothetical protein SAMN05414137_1832 [Streptacidiphilus jiangxiensis]